MKLEINSYMSIEVTEPNELLELMSDDEQIELIESLSCRESVIKHVSDQLIHGCTENGHSGWMSYGESPQTATQLAIRGLIENINNMAYQEIQRLESLVKGEKEATQYWVDKFHSKSGGNY